MKTKKVLTAVLVAGILTAVFLYRVETVTHAYKVSTATGRPYLSLLLSGRSLSDMLGLTAAPLSRVTVMPVVIYTGDPENLDDGIDDTQLSDYITA